MPKEVRGIITTLKDQDGNIKFPRTVGSAVDIDGEKLDEIIEQKVNKSVLYDNNLLEEIDNTNITRPNIYKGQLEFPYGFINGNNGIKASHSYICGYICEVNPNTTYKFKNINGLDGICNVSFADNEKNYLFGYGNIDTTQEFYKFTTNENTYYFRFAIDRRINTNYNFILEEIKNNELKNYKVSLQDNSGNYLYPKNFAQNIYLNDNATTILEEKDKRGYLLSNFHKYVENGDWAPAVHKAIEFANLNNGFVLIDGMYTIKSQITIPTSTCIQGYGFTYGQCGFTLDTEGITAIEIRGVAITMKNLVVKASKRFETETHGIVFSSTNEPDTNKWHAFCNIRDIRVDNFNGYGIKFDSIHDSLVENISIERCGNSNCYAFYVGSTDDTSNHTNFNRIQVEQCYTKAMYVDISTLCCVFTNIHSERVKNIDPTIPTHYLSGGRCTYTNARIENSTQVDEERPILKIGGPGSTYESISAIDTLITNIIETNRITTYFKFCNLRNISHKAIASGNFIYCNINGLDFSGEIIEFSNCTISNVKLGGSTIKDKFFYNCKFIDLGYDAAFYKGNFINCSFEVLNNEYFKVSPKCIFENCNFICPTKIYYDREIIIKNSILENFEISGSNASVTLINNIINTFTRGINQDNSIKWINNIYDGTFATENKDFIVLLKDNR